MCLNQLLISLISFLRTLNNRYFHLLRHTCSHVDSLLIRECMARTSCQNEDFKFISIACITGSKIGEL
eukprot:5810251-Heterocapsa_arctica.AAC.2